MKDLILILGSGPGGLAAANILLTQGYPVIIFEKEATPGGLLKTVKFKKHSLDLGHKQLYGRIQEVKKYWSDLLGEDLIPIKHRAGILYEKHILEKSSEYKGKFRGLPLELLSSCVLDFAKTRIKYSFSAKKNLEQWSHAQRGPMLTKIFSQNFAEHFTGRKWRDSAIPTKNSTNDHHSSILFHPKYGSGQITEKTILRIKKLGGSLHLNSKVVSLKKRANSTFEVTVNQNHKIRKYRVPKVISALPLEILASLLKYKVNPEKEEHSFTRSTIIVYLFLKKPVVFPHHMLQVTTPNSILGRITNYNAYQGRMVAENKGCLGIEIFLTRNDVLFQSSDHEIADRVLKECSKANLFHNNTCENYLVIKTKNADAAVGWQDYQECGTRLNIFNNIDKIQGLFNVSRPGIDKSTHAGLLAATSIIKNEKIEFSTRTRPEFKTPWNSFVNV